tara:strand:- start:33415 stop:35568 length:2154 start_codon:yes stop_codon:yes gene_type:complete
MFSTDDASEYNKDFRAVPAIVIPYIDPFTDDYSQYLDGDENAADFMRIRYLDAPKSKGFTKKKFIRYSQPKDSGVHAYFPVVSSFKWGEVLADTSQPIMFTEGEKKALAACLAGVPTIGLGGVYNFTDGGVFLPILDKIAFKGRAVLICYDSDAAGNSKIRLAEDRLAVELSLKRGALLSLIRLPDAEDGSKVGIDDYLVEHGDEAVDLLVEGAKPLRAIDREVLSMNEDVAWLENEGLIVDLKTGQLIKKDNFKDGSIYSSRSVSVADTKGNFKEISVAAAWLKHPNKRWYNEIVFRPDTVDNTVEVKGGGVAYNRFRGLSGQSGDVTPFFDLYDHLMSTTDEFDKDMIWKLICWKVQNLGSRPKLGIMMTGTQGGGKTLFTDIISKMFHPYYAEISSADLGSDFNAWIEGSLCVVMNEAKGKDLQFSMDTLKGYVTDETKACNEKYRPRRQVTNYGLYMFNSNQRSAAAFDDDDRRMIIMRTPKKHKNGRDFYGPVFDWYENGGSQSLLRWFQEYDLEGWVPPIMAPETREKRMAHFASQTPVQKLAARIKIADTNIVEAWITTALEWAHSIINGAAGSSASQLMAAQNVDEGLASMTIRPFYTPEELIKIFAPMAEEFAYGRVSNISSGMLTKQFLQEGVEYLKCKDNYDGFKHGGMIKQYLVIADHDQWEEPISQAEFDRAMLNDFPSYGKLKAAQRKAAQAEKRVSKRNKEA